MAKATTHPTCTPTNLNIRTRSSTLYANAPILLASILLNFRRRPESHLQLQVSEKSAVSSQQSTVNSQQSAVSSQQSAVRVKSALFLEFFEADSIFRYSVAPDF